MECLVSSLSYSKNYTFNCYDTVPCHACICARWIREIGLNQIHYKILMSAPKTWWTLVKALAAKPLHIHGTQQRSSIHVQPCNVKHCIKKSLLNSIWSPLYVWLDHSGGLSQIPTAKTCSTPWQWKCCLMKHIERAQNTNAKQSAFFGCMRREW